MLHHTRRLLSLIVVSALGAVALPLTAQDFASVEIKTLRVADGLHMLVGRGGNVAVSTGADGPLMIDDQFAPLAPKLEAAIRKLQDAPVRFLVNTHYHGDHVGGNAAFGERGALIVAQHNVRRRLGAGPAPSPRAALPVLSFEDDLVFHWNGETIELQHLPRAHTDGDAIVWFHNADAVHLGDLFFNGNYPFIDTGAGGSLAGVGAALDAVLERVSAKTRIIPGHGPLADADDLRAYREMLSTVRSRVQTALCSGDLKRKTFVATQPLADLDPQWGGGFMKTDRFLSILWADLESNRRQVCAKR